MTGEASLCGCQFGKGLVPSKARGVLRRDALYGARCFLAQRVVRLETRPLSRLNAPYGARRFLTRRPWTAQVPARSRLNAPYGARCFLTHQRQRLDHLAGLVLMHLMALSAFNDLFTREEGAKCIMS